MKRLCDVLSWSISFRYQLVHREDVSNWLLLFTYLWDLAKTSQIGPSYWRTSWDVVIMFQYDRGRSNWSLNWVSFFWVLGSRFFLYQRSFLFKVPASKLLQRVKDVILIRYQFYQSLQHVKLASLSLCMNWYVITASQIGRFLSRTNKTSQIYLK